MAMMQGSIAVGVFPNTEQARKAIDNLKRAGFSDDELGFLSRARAGETAGDVASDAATGAVSGGVLGGVLGAAAALLIPGLGPALAGGILAATLGGAAVGAAAGGLATALTSMGVVENDARFYQKELQAGHTIVTVKTDGGHEDAEKIMHDAGATHTQTHTGIFPARPPIRPYGAPPKTYDPTIPDENIE